MGHAVCCALKNCADAHDGRSDEDGLLAAEIVTEDEGCDCAHETANVVDGLELKV